MSEQASTLRSWTWGEAPARRRIALAVGIGIFVLATSIGARVAVPLPWTPVPMTLQPLFFLLAGAVLGPWAGAASMALYLAIGAAGAPVFSAGHAGLPWLLGPTGGYLLAAPAAAFVVGLIAGTGRSGLLRLALALAAGLAILYAGGLSQLWILTGQDLGSLLALGVVPFVGGDLVKLGLALVLARSARIRSLGQP